MTRKSYNYLVNLHCNAPNPRKISIYLIQPYNLFLYYVYGFLRDLEKQKCSFCLNNNIKKMHISGVIFTE